MGLWEFVVLFSIGAAVLAVSGTVLARSGDRIGEETGLGGVTVGALLIAAVTSLPELLTSTSAAAVGSPALAVSSLLGSSMANMAVLALLDLLYHRRVWATAAPNQVQWAAAAIALTSLAVAGVADPGLPRLGWVGVDTIVLALAYIGTVSWLTRSPDDLLTGKVRAPVRWRAATRPNVTQFLMGTGGVVAAAPLVAWSAQGITTTSGLGEEFVGVAFLAVATSLPELITSLSAGRIGAYDLAIGNLFGSNLFNVAILVVPDVFTPEGPLLAAAGASQVVTGAAAIGLMAVALAAISTGQESRLRNRQPDAVLLLVLYAAAVIVA